MGEPTGYCECGCGEQTKVARKTSVINGTQRGVPLRFVHGHNRRKSAVEYLINENGCWIWQRARHARGYGITYAEGRTVYAHRVIWERHRGLIPAGLELDHLCRNHSCVNPDHLEPVSHKVNMNRGVWPNGRRKKPADTA